MSNPVTGRGRCLELSNVWRVLARPLARIFTLGRQARITFIPCFSTVLTPNGLHGAPTKEKDRVGEGLIHGNLAVVPSKKQPEDRTITGCTSPSENDTYQVNQ